MVKETLYTTLMSNKHTGSNKRTGWKILEKTINMRVQIKVLGGKKPINTPLIQVIFAE